MRSLRADCGDVSGMPLNLRAGEPRSQKPPVTRFSIIPIGKFVVAVIPLMM